MSWLLGDRYKQHPPTQMPPGDPGGDGAAPGGGTGGEPPKIGKGMDAYRFDSSALERAAAAAKELERSGKICYPKCLFHYFNYWAFVGSAYVRLRKVLLLFLAGG